MEKNQITERSPLWNMSTVVRPSLNCHSDFTLLICTVMARAGNSWHQYWHGKWQCHGYSNLYHTFRFHLKIPRISCLSLVGFIRDLSTPAILNTSWIVFFCLRYWYNSSPEEHLSLLLLHQFVTYDFVCAQMSRMATNNFSLRGVLHLWYTIFVFNDVVHSY